MIPQLAFLLIMMQVVPVPAPSSEITLSVSCSVVASNSFTDPRPGQHAVSLLKSASELSSKRHLTVNADTVSVRYDELSCRSAGQEHGCAEGIAIIGHTFTVKVPLSGVADITWPTDWTDRERNFALTDLPLVLAVAASTPQTSAPALTEGLLDAVPGATLKANEAAPETGKVGGLFQGTGVSIPLSGSIDAAAGRVTLKAEGVSQEQANAMGQVSQDKVSILCTREMTR